jgi:hypothetical protein
MRQFHEGRLTFTFPDPLEAAQYDSWAFYRNQFNSAFGGTKAIDFICIDNDKTWLIEVKDYRANRRTKAIDLADEVALKPESVRPPPGSTSNPLTCMAI